MAAERSTILVFRQSPPLKSGVVRTVTFCCRPYIATGKKPGLLPRIPVPADNGKYRDSRMAAIISNTF